MYGFWKIDKKEDEATKPIFGEERIKKHDTNYLVILIASSFASLLVIEIVTSLPANPYLVLYYLTFFALTTGTALLRLLKPYAGRIATRFLNIVLLVFFPVGTVIGVYGLWKVDQKTKPGAQPPAAAAAGAGQHKP